MIKFGIDWLYESYLIVFSALSVLIKRVLKMIHVPFFLGYYK